MSRLFASVYGAVAHALFFGTSLYVVFAIATTAYMLIGVQLQEHDLIGWFGDTPVAYRK